ncbi:MAG: hypothetical protein E7127_06820 [Rikenellaceae bacterium]|nr:hypothetical protein [Rikenellaceae bacterium]
MAKRVSQHRIFDLTVTLIVIAILCTLRSALLPVGDEAIPNVSTPIGHLLQTVQQQVPFLAAIIWALSIIVAGLNAGRYGVRLSLYPAYTLMGITLFGVVATAVMTSSDYLLSAASMAVMLLATKYMQRCIMRSGSYSDLSLSMLYFGLLPLIYAPAALLYVAMPLLVLVARASWRDELVTLGSLFFPPAALCYWSWCAGKGFTEPAIEIYNSMLTASEFSFFGTINPASVLLLGVLLVMAMCAVTLIISDKYSLKVKARVAMRFNALMLLLLVGMFLLPSCTATQFALLAVPASMMLPLIFVRMGVGFTETLYRLLLLAAALNCVVMCL